MSTTADDRGAAVVDFVLVSVLVVLLFALVFQVGLALHTRNVLVALAAEGARFGANADVTDEGAVEARTRQGIATAFSSGYAGRAVIDAELGGPVAVVVVRAPLPLPFVPGAPLQLEVRGRALEEGR